MHDDLHKLGDVDERSFHPRDKQPPGSIPATGGGVAVSPRGTQLERPRFPPPPRPLQQAELRKKRMLARRHSLTFIGPAEVMAKHTLKRGGGGDDGDGNDDEESDDLVSSS